MWGEQLQGLLPGASPSSTWLQVPFALTPNTPSSGLACHPQWTKGPLGWGRLPQLKLKQPLAVYVSPAPNSYVEALTLRTSELDLSWAP